MSEVESQVDESVEADEVDEQETGSLSKMSYEDLEAELAKTRREAAKNRVGKSENADKAKKYDELVRAQMSEVDRVKAEKDELAKELAAVHRERAQAKAARSAKLDPDLADRIHGETDEEMLADAKRLAKKYPAGSSSNEDSTAGAGLFPGTRGKAVGADANATDDEVFRSLFS